MKTARITLVALVVLAIALAPMVLHLSLWAPRLVHAGHRHMAIVSVVGAAAWFALWLQALPPLRRTAQATDCQAHIQPAPLFSRYPWLGPLTLACVIAVWASLDRYLEMTQ